jgi:hypothetical protein
LIPQTNVSRPEGIFLSEHAGESLLHEPCEAGMLTISQLAVFVKFIIDIE